MLRVVHPTGISARAFPITLANTLIAALHERSYGDFTGAQPLNIPANGMASGITALQTEKWWGLLTRRCRNTTFLVARKACPKFKSTTI